MKFVIDRIENGIAICEDVENRNIFEIGIDKLPSECKEGSVVIFENNTYMIDVKEEKARKKRIKEKMKKLWE